MKTSKILDQPENTIEGLEIETPILESIHRNCLALIASTRKHIQGRDAAERAAKAALEQDDHDSYTRWMDIVFQEDGSIELLFKILDELGISRELVETKAKEN